MRSHSEIFNQDGYTYLPNFLDKENCQQYVEEFRKLISQGKAKKDDQCPLSFSLGHTSLFDSLLEQLTPNVQAATGKKLLPTYAYARWYAPGDELKIHRDRPSCEISATITLGFQGDAWPIYMGYDGNKKNCRQINMSVGDAVIYKGCEMYHWREKYIEGQWQAQVFIHYVDANGPNAEWKYDKRKKLAHHEEEISSYKILRKGFSQEAVNNIINNFENNMHQSIDATLTGEVIDKSVRDSKKIQIDPNRGIAASLIGMGLNCNKQYWNFDITHGNQSEYLRYDKNGHFKSHTDTILEDFSSNITRKITIIAILNNDYEGGRLYFHYGNEREYPKLEPGDVVIFPSFLVHGVEPIISGIRRSVVTWLVGPYFK